MRLKGKVAIVTGVEMGISVEFARRRVDELGSCRLRCDEFFEKRYKKALPKSTP